uniref:Uncharacterized protein n=1 Tax=Fagus sylvatica TaxID=28930 RepID=A0A2N9HEZ9_FAGSY
MPIQRRTVNIGSVLGTLAPEPSETSNIPLAPGFSERESVMKKRKKGEEEVEAAKEQKDLIQAEPSATKSLSKKGKGKDSRTPQKAAGHISHKRKHQKEPPAPWKCEFYVDGRPLNEDDSVWKSKDVRGGQIADAVGSALLLPKDMKSWKGSNSTQMIENLKRDSVVAVQGVFEAGYRLIEAERLLNESLVENDRLREVEKTASARIREVEGQHKTAEEGLQTWLSANWWRSRTKLERECERSSGFQAEIDKLRAELAEARRGGLRLLSRLRLMTTLKLYVLGRHYRPFDNETPENLEETNVEVLEDREAVDDPTALETAEVFDHQERAQTEEVQDVEKGISDKEDDQIAPNRHIIPFIWSSQPPSLEDVLEISIKVSMYTNNRTSREFVATENLEETSVEVLEECEAIDD